MDKNFLKLINQKKEFEKNGKMFPLEKEKELAIYRTQISDHFRWVVTYGVLRLII